MLTKVYRKFDRWMNFLTAFSTKSNGKMIDNSMVGKKLPGSLENALLEIPLKILARSIRNT